MVKWTVNAPRIPIPTEPEIPYNSLSCRLEPQRSIHIQIICCHGNHSIDFWKSKHIIHLGWLCYQSQNEINSQFCFELYATAERSVLHGKVHIFRLTVRVSLDSRQNFVVVAALRFKRKRLFIEIYSFIPR